MKSLSKKSVSIVLIFTIISGLGPASIVSKKDPVESLRGE